jgi:response regulator RpfG family c-di-GMP phosphodiesterase
MRPRLLVVDDEPLVRQAIERELSSMFHVETAASGELGAEALETKGPFAVVVADYRMPGMNGVEFLARVRAKAPDTARVVMTRAGDMEAAIAAVNEGHVFRFIALPCPAPTLRQVLLGALRQHRLLTAEREVLEQTLAGVVRVLTDVLGLVNPDAFGRAARVKNCVQHLAAQLGLPNAWQYEVAAMLSQIGCVTLPGDTLAKVLGGQSLTPTERELVEAVPRVASTLIGHIPRLGPVSRMVGVGFEDIGPPPADADALRALAPDRAGAWLLRVALALDERMMRVGQPRDAIADLRRPQHNLPAFLLDALERFVFQAASSRLEMVGVRELHTLMVLDEDVRTSAGLMLVPRGQPVTVAVVQRLRSFARSQGVREPFRVRIPDPSVLSASASPLESGPLSPGDVDLGM